MRTIRRLYLYLVAVISLETVLWGVINLLRAMMDTSRVGGSTTQLAGALATIIVGVPVFFLHWWLIQRRIGDEPEDRGSGVRAIFLYGMLFGLLLPVAQNALALLNRALIDLFGQAPETAFLGFNQTWLDNGIALLMNALLAAYFMSVLRGDWRAGVSGDPGSPPLENLTLARRVFRYALVTYSLGLLVVGVQQVLQYILDQAGPPNVRGLTAFANGLSLAVFGALLWWNTWRTAQAALARPEERRSLFRLVFLYIVVLFGVSAVLLALGDILFTALQALLGQKTTFTAWLLDVSGAIAVAIPLGAVWAYHASVLRADLDDLPSTPRRDGMWRLYRYLLAFIGLLVTFAGLELLAEFTIEALAGGDARLSAPDRSTLASALASLLIGLPLWLRSWLQVGRQASHPGEEGDHARRSLVRRAYLYIAIFIGVVGVMGSAGALVFRLLNILLGNRAGQTLEEILQLIKTLALFSALLAYHWQVLSRDSARSQLALSEKHSLFPVLILDPGDEAFAQPILAAIRDEAEEMPVAVHFTGTGAPGEDLANAGAVVLSSGMAANPPEALRIWLQAFQGTRFVVPSPRPGWQWVEADPVPVGKRARLAAAALRKMAEGEGAEGGGRVSPWIIVLAVIGGLVGLSILISTLVELLRF